MGFKAIETRYKGYRFRSRLEARWAVFFDAMGEPWEYEKEGYDLDGTPYLPDFFLPGMNCFVEIKGVTPTAEELRKAELLRDGSGFAVAVFYGLPTENKGRLYCWDISDSSGGSSEWDVFLCNTAEGDLAFGLPERWRDRSFLADAAMAFYLPTQFGYFPCVKTDIALDAAKAARFEHGEKG